MDLGSRIVSWGATCMNSWCLSRHRSRKFEQDFLDAEGLWMKSVEPRKRWPFRFRVQTLSRLQAEVCLSEITLNDQRSRRSIRRRYLMCMLPSEIISDDSTNICLDFLGGIQAGSSDVQSRGASLGHCLEREK